MSAKPHFINLFRTMPTDNLLLLISLGHMLTSELTESLKFISPFRTVVDPIAGAPQRDADVVAGAPEVCVDVALHLVAPFLVTAIPAVIHPVTAPGLGNAHLATHKTAQQWSLCVHLSQPP